MCTYRRLKAFKVFVPDGEWCLLVFAHTRGGAKTLFISFTAGLTMDFEYTDIVALRRPKMDQHSSGDKPFYIDDNLGLPEGVSFYTEE